MRSRTLLVSAGLVVAGAWLVSRRRSRRPLVPGSVALVTGGSRGLGFLLARELGRRKVRVVICARDEQELERARTVLAGEGLDVTALPCDVSDDEGMRTLVADVEENIGPIDVLVNNAGIIQVGPSEAMTLEDYRHALDVMFYGPLNAA